MANNNNYKGLIYNENVSIIFVAEQTPETAFQIFRCITNQIYKKIEYVILYNENFDIANFKKLIYENTDLNITTPIKYLKIEFNYSVLDIGIKECSSEIVFIKATNPSVWFPNHILAHLKIHKQKHFKNSICFSHIKFHNIRTPIENPFGALGYRLTKKINHNDIYIDEISFTKDSAINFSECPNYLDENGNKLLTAEGSKHITLDSEKVLEQAILKSNPLQFTDEITMVVLTDSPNQSNQILTKPDWKNLNTIQSVTEDLDIRHRMPTLFGNTQIDEQWNNQVRIWIKENFELLKTYPQKRIILKRTVGLGDVLLTEPIVRYFKEQLQGIEVWFVTADSRSCKNILEYFENKPDFIVTIPEFKMGMDLLGENNLPVLLKENGYDSDIEFDLKIDLDMAYESRKEIQYIKAYFMTLGLNEEEIENLDLMPRLNYSGIIDNSEKYIAVCLEGSGWICKEINVPDAKYILESIKSKGYKLYHTSNLIEKYKSLEYLFDKINKENSFETMMSYIYNCQKFIGSDNGPMHVAASFGKKIFVWNGAALTEKTSPYTIDNLTILKKENLDCVGIKHKMFFELVQTQNGQKALTFVPNCKNRGQCMTTFDRKLIDKKLEEFNNKWPKI